MTPALDGIRVFDASAGVAGPYAGHLLALAGAEVVKIEPPQGDWGRMIGRKAGSLATSFLAFNTGKRSLAVDLKSCEGLALAREIALQCDVVLESFRPGVMDRLGLGYEVLSAVRPDLVYLSISGFGSRGPHAKRPALDTVIQAQAGWLDLVRDNDQSPVLMEYVPIDVLTGIYGAQAVFAALIGRFRFGEGRRLEVSLLEAAAAFLAPKLIEAELIEPAVGASAGVPTGIFPTASGMVAMAIKDDREFAQLAAALGHAEWASDPRFVTRASRGENREACEAAVTEALAARDADGWDEHLAKAGIVAAKVNTVRELVKDAHFKALDRLVWANQAGIGSAPRVKVPGIENPSIGAAPAIGEHSRQILADFGVDGARIDTAISSGAVIVAGQGE